MKNPLWAKAIQNCADPQRARHYHKLFAAATRPGAAKISSDQIPVLVALFSGSQAMSDWLVANPECISELDLEHIRHPRRAQGFKREVEKFLKPALAAREYPVALAQLRRFKQREMLRIAARDLSRVANAIEITREISDVADLCLESVWRICRAQFSDRFGRPYHPDAAGRWHETAACVLGMGKLGGQELNYSSDVDLLFVYADEGQAFREPPGGKTPSPRTMSSHQYFNRLAESFIAEVTRLSPDGVLFRVDLRLRPEGDTGPLCRSLESYENFYAQWGQTWERMMLIKARCVAGDASLGHEFAEMIQPFRFPRSLNEGVLREVAAMKDRIEQEVVKSGELERNVKLGRGGIREIEFVAQSLQLLHAGRLPFLQTGQTLPCLAKLAQYKWLTETEARELTAAYCFLRDIEHRCQMDANLQTHTIPADKPAQERLAKLMGFSSLKKFDSELRAHTGHVRRTYDRLLKREKTGETEVFPREFDAASAEWKKILAAHRFRDPDAAFRVLKEFAEGPGYVHVSTHTTDLARQLIPRILELCPKTEDRGQRSEVGTPASVLRPPTSDLRRLSDPDRVVTRLDNFITAYGARAALFEVWNSKPAMFELLLTLFDRSEFLAELAIRTPDLIDDLVMRERLQQRKAAAEILRDLKHGIADPDQFLWLRRYHEAEQMRLGLRDILGLADFEQNLVELSALADACLQYAMQIVMREERLKRAPFAIIGLGKLGGREINYGSDLDVVFVTEAKAKDLPKLQKLAARVMDLLSRRTEQGIVFPTDARLRPDGEKGLLVNTLEAFEEYYRQRAQLWEIQSLTRARAVAGDAKTGAKFQTLAAGLTDFTVKQKAESGKLKAEKNETPHVVAYSSDWKKRIHEMRMRIEKERTPLGKDELAIKTGRGGLMDGEFIAQALCLEYGWQEAHTLRALERGREAGMLPDAEKLMENYRQLRRLEGILRRWSYEGETVLPDDPAPYYRVAVRCGFATPQEFRAALAGWRAGVREVYAKFFGVDRSSQK
ncbi:MAG: bifunctional [glutamate--ammonia ligase]-adenylyl-L-tyrosine phosphorylase/[glutamate--ammonia-ligase] adenylyltransferase [Pedosphaera sp.]|nr:bifunctional [glutamate--ammonia ligase]-adenylyl-L-tyrosine phosphorylase/[glutamate--ammonia-ligase] adenylyltransferase [Pedosphaera sp.]